MNEKFMLWFTLLNICVCSADNNNKSPLVENISVNCGSSGASTSENGKKWLGDITTRSLTSVRVEGSSTTSTQKLNNNAVDPIPYKTARASRSSFSYEFQAGPGEKIIRLHFSPGSYKGFQRSMDLIDVEAGRFTLLGNFSASLTAEALGVKSFVKEFCVKVEENRLLRITFSPANGDAYAFVNGIEIISVPNVLSYFGVSAFEVFGRKSLVHLDRNGALEHVYRWNAKTESYLASRNNDDLFPTWTSKKDDNKAKNDTFKVLVDVGFNYLIRLHFSELILLKMAARDEVIFKVFIGETLAQSNVDLFKETGENSMKRHGDYLVAMRGQKNEGKSHLLISVESSDEFIYGSRILEGLEILKLANIDNSLASPNPVPVPQRSLGNSTVKYILSVIGYKNAIFAIVTAIVSVASIIVWELQEISEANSVVEEANKPSERAQRICRQFSLDEIRSATKFYSVDLLIGRGGFGCVYKGTIDGGQETVAVKKLKLDSRQGAREFLAEIETLSELRHVNLVPLIGYCNEYGEMMLVYKYMSGGTLADHLYKNARKNRDCSPALTWKQRLNVCIGAARGLDYLHTGHGIIHRDIKSSNILLDENLEAKVSDFGLAKPEDRSKSRSHVSTNVKGTFGYLDPHYCITRKLTRRSDTYAFGVVLFEVLCGRPALSSKLSEDERVLVNWVQGKIKEDTDQIVDPSLREEISPDSLKIYVEVAERCINIEPKKRPAMSQVVVQLEIALQLQESEAFTASNEKTFASNDNHQSLGDGTGLSNIEEEVKLTSSDDKNRSEEQQDEEEEVKLASSAGLALPSADNYARKDKMNKSPWLWPVGAFWERVRFSRSNVLRELGISEADIKIHKFDWYKIVAATNRFSSKIGYCLYRGVLPTGQVIAVKKFPPTYGPQISKNGKLQKGQEIVFKRLSNTGQDYLEFKNEVLLLARLQHRNLVRLLGFSVEGERKLLVYEFVQNASLDQFIFDPVKRSVLDWNTRSKIIEGIARGLLYLHEDSRLRIIHHHLKASNILLDSEMNPKIADFGMARLLVQDDQTHGSTSRIAGTHGYMAPEYMIRGQFSIKSDVYSFGVLLLEIVSGQKNNCCFRNCQDNSILLSVAWRSWREGTAANIIDPILKSASGSMREMLRCIHIGLLCVQENVADRPTMASVVLMLGSLSLTLVVPSVPGFCVLGYEMETDNIRSESDEKKLIDSSHSHKSEMPKNEASITELYPR